MTSPALAFQIAIRELRGSLSKFRVFLIALTLGVTAIGAVGSIAESMRYGIAVNSRLLFGGDLDASSTHKPAPKVVLEEMAKHGQTSSVIMMRAMLGSVKDDQPIRRLVSLKVVDDHWPLLGAPRLDPPIPLDQALSVVKGNPGIVANPGLLRVLGADVGDTVRLGDIDVHVSAILLHEPDRSFGFEQFAPSVILADENLDATGLNVPGALMTYRERLLLDNPARDLAILSLLKSTSENSLVRLRHHRQGSAGFQAFLSRTETFLTLVSLTALLIGGLGVSSAVRAWLTNRMPVLATLKCLGAPAPLIFWVYFIQVLILTTLGVALGLGLAVITPWVVKALLGAVVVVPIETGLFPAPLLAAGGFGFLTAITFSVWPLGKAREVNPSQLFRTLITVPTGKPKKRYLGVIALSTIGLMALTWWATTSPVLAIGFMVGVLGSLALLAVLGDVVVRSIKRLPKIRNTALSLAMAALVRPGNSTRTVIVTFGLGLTVLVAIAVSEFNMNRQINTRLEDEAPAWFFIDIQPHQQEEFLSTTAGFVGADNIVMVPLVRGRVVALNGVPAAEINAPQSEEWILRGDRGLTWSPTPPEGARIVKGEWWDADHTGPMEVSMDDEAMVAFGLDLGDSVTLNIAGRELMATITSSRQIEWQNFGLNFVFVLSPGMIEAAPHNWVATVATDDPETEAAVDRNVAALMPNVSSISVREAAVTVGRILGLVSMAIQITASITLVAGFSVLAGTVAASEARRINSSIILKVLGATRRVILMSYIYEYALLGLITGLVAVAIGTAASYAVIGIFLQTSFVFPPVLAAGVALGGAMATVVLGLIGASRTLGRKPGPVLRQD
ncbi:MAG: ABC transporter permease [Alphaproteobacteria bacterium]|nr:ABC transporter permease [Alphaproteobacteria bacterium]